MANFTRAGPTSRPLAFPARSGVTRCASGWDPPSGEPCSAFWKSFPKLGSSVPVEADQGTGCLHSWVHRCFTPSSYFNLQVLLPVARCALCHFGRLLKGCFTSVLLCSFVFLVPPGKITLKHESILFPLPRLPTCTGGHLRFSLSYLMLRITAATQEVRTSVPGATQKTHLWPGNTAACLPVRMVGNCSLWFLPLWLFWGHARCLHSQRSRPHRSVL